VLRAEPESASVARRLTRRLCDDVGLDDDTRDAAILLTSETVTNAVVHGRSDVRLTVTADAHGVRVEAGDDNSRHPVLQAQDEDALDGRGLALLDAVASCWGVEDGHYGKVVWFEVHAPGARAPSAKDATDGVAADRPRSDRGRPQTRRRSAGGVAAD
jgi:hypothetical protein